jgi:DNA-binding NarL/FixJ family response regulator
MKKDDPVCIVTPSSSIGVDFSRHLTLAGVGVCGAATPGEARGRRASAYVLAGLGGREVVNWIRELWRNAASAPVVSVVGPGEGEPAALLAAGARGVVSAARWQRELAGAVRTVKQGRFFAPPETLHQFAIRAQQITAPYSALSESEARIIELVRQGWSNRRVARARRISERAVKYHLKHAYRKLNVRGRAELRAG